MTDCTANIGTSRFPAASQAAREWALESIAQFREMGCLYEPGRYSPTPLCFSETTFSGMLDDVRSVLALARRIAFDSGLVQRWARPDQLALLEKGLSRAVLPMMARPDGIFVDGNLKLLELNIDSGLGGYFEVELAQQRLAEFNERFLDGAFMVPAVMPAIYAYLKSVAHSLDKPKWNVAVMIDNHLTDYNRSHAYLFVDKINQHVPEAYAKVVFPSELYQEGSQLRDSDTTFDILWRFGSMAHSPDALAPSIAIQMTALDTNVILVCNPADIGVEGKLILALLSEYADDDSSQLKDFEKQLVSRLVPWTRTLRRGCTSYSGRPVDLEKFAVSEKDALVLKRAHSKSAQQVYIGSELSQEDWNTRIWAALEDDISWVLQENMKSDLIQFDYVRPDGTTYTLEQRYSINPFIFGDASAAPFIRVERDEKNRRIAIANVDAMAICGVMVRPDPVNESGETTDKDSE
ncbi:hypothetical protein [Janthinobacterium fluminis]|uniref:Circularly permuted type 2 ATP-grasp protein n=1 Tax=Janthinobacterium fluminis TaxID=2987524 RepID=A0ABT5JXZ3_9BURK|nr:hypothetical protein [Janthinobacterium fluminis]MDC8757305.1 hypothetical protein [Janthinobacterium fluminis]